MTKVAITSNASGAGTFTLAAPNSDTDRTLSLPDAAGTVFLSDAFNTIQPSNISDGTTTVGTEYVVNGSAKSWVNFDGTGTVAIRDSFNVASLTDNGTGDYTINFGGALVDVNYAVSGMRSRFDPNSVVTLDQNTSQTTNSFTILTGAGGSSSPEDSERVHLIVAR